MILKSLKLNNIRSYTDEEIVFPEGSTLLSGDIGAGKSSILMAVEFALFGIMRAELSGSSLLRNGKNSGFIELDFSVDNKEVKIRRTLKRNRDAIKQDAGFIVINGVQSDMTPLELKAKVVELIGYPGDMLTSAKSLIFRYTVYTPQEAMKKIVFDEPRERLNNLRKIFGIDKYKTIASNAEIVSKKLGEKARLLSERVADLDEKTRQKQEAESEVEKFHNQLNEILPRLKESRQDFEDKKNEKAKKEETFNRYNKIKGELEVIKTKLEEKEGSKKRVEAELEDIRKGIQKLESQSKQLDVQVSLEGLEEGLKKDEQHYTETLSALSALKSKKADKENNIKLLKEEIEEFEKRMSQAEKRKKKLDELRELLTEKESFEQKLKQVQEEIAKLQREAAAKEAWEKTAAELKESIDEIDKCPLCHQPIFLGQKEQIREDQEKRILELKEEIRNSDVKRKALEEDRAETEARIKKFVEMEKEIERLSGALADSRFLEEGHNERKERLVKMEQELEGVVKRIKDNDAEELHRKVKNKREILQKAKEAEVMSKNIREKEENRKKMLNYLDEINREIKSINSKKAELAEQMKGFEGIEEKLSLAQKEIEEMGEKVRQLEMQKLSFEKDIENKQKTLQGLKEEISKKKETKTAIQKLTEKRAWLKDKFAPFVQLVESHIMQKVYEEFDSHFKQWVSILLEDETINARLEEDFTPKVEQDGYEMSVEDLSGGEKTSFALAYRLALNKVINDVLSAIKTKQLLILDEPTDGFSSEQLDKMRDILEQLNANQVIIVSHEPKLESFVQNIIRIDKSHSVSRALA